MPGKHATHGRKKKRDRTRGGKKGGKKAGREEGRKEGRQASSERQRPWTPTRGQTVGVSNPPWSRLAWALQALRTQDGPPN